MGTTKNNDKEICMKKVLIGVGILFVVGMMLISDYNNLVSSEEGVNGQWSQVETQLQRRADLIPNLVETVKAYAAQEEAIFTALAEARAKLAGATGVEETQEANAELSNAIGRLLVIVENYPELKSNVNFLALQDELAGTENRIATARRDYNLAVQNFNTRVRSFPTSLIAGLFGFDPQPYFETDETDAPNVNF
jgi:LemA protein